MGPPRDAETRAGAGPTPAPPTLHRRIVAGVAALALVAAGLAARATFAGAYGAGPFSFPHQPHLAPATIAAGLAEAQSLDRTGRRPGGGGTVDRECRVCHDFTKGAETHLTGCDPCHVGTKNLDVVRAPAAAGTPPFAHKEHLKDTSITCFTCHVVQKENGWVEFSIPAAGLGTARADGRPGGKHGEGTCADCHRSHEPKAGIVSDDVTGDGKPCGTCHVGVAAILPSKYRPAQSGNDRSFLHADHGGAGGNCEACHAPVRASRTTLDYDPTVGTKQACETCHVDAEGKPLVGVASPGRTTKLPAVAFSRFPHDKHLAPPKGEIRTSGKVTDGCRTCHYPETDPAAAALFPGRKPSAEPVGRGALVDYDSCVPCHAEWKVEGHGVGEWSCFKCHSGKADAQGKLPVAKAQVTRSGLAGGVQFEAHHHPGVATSGRPLADASQPGGKECRDCHVGDVKAVPSRVLGRTFRHDPHLPADPKAADCIGCHTTSLTASWSADLTRFDPHLDAPPTASDADGKAKPCLACHVGATAAQLNAQPSSRTVPEFDHRGHVVGAKWKGGAGVPCMECHVGGGDTGYETPQDVYDCSRCHSHDETQKEKFERTGKKTSSEAAAKACMACHDEEIRGSAAPPQAVVRTHLSLLPGTQHHDKQGKCASCHAREKQPYAYRERITKSKVALSIHEDPALAKEWFNDPRIAKAGFDPQGRTCTSSCHRFEPRGYLRALETR